MTVLNRWAAPVVVAALTALAVIAVFHMQLSVANYDPQYMRVLVERTVRYGGSYYENGIHNKGPLEPAVYEIARRVGGWAGFWFVIAVFTLVTSLVIGVAAAIAADRAGAPRIVAVAVAVMAVTHLTLSDSDYAGVLYSRNITVGLLALAFVVGAWDAAWTSHRRRVVAVAGVGLAVGLAVQTLLTTCFAATAVLAWAMWSRRTMRVWRYPVWAALPVSAALGLLTAPVYYRVVGPWDAFVDGWWTYARWMNTATGRGLGGQIELGLDQFAEYYGDRPLLLVVVVAFVVEGAVRWRALEHGGRALRAMIAGWWLAAWVELAVSQRYSSHYFSILAVPALLMIAVLAGGLTHRLRPGAPGFQELRVPAALLTVLPLAIAVITIHVGGTRSFREGFREASAFHGVDDFAASRERVLDGRTLMVRAALDLVSEPDDPLLMWTSYPWPYLNLRRAPATRYIWKNFLLGEIYLAQSGPQYVLPGTWETFVVDVDRTDPTAFLVEAVNPVAPGTPFETLVSERFTELYDDDVLALSLRNDLATWLRAPPSRPVAVDGSDVGRLVADVPLTLGDGCARFDGRLRGADAGRADGFDLVRFGVVSGVTGAEATISFGASGPGGVTAVSRPATGAAFATAMRATDGPVDFTLVVGARAAVLVVDGRLVGAVQLAATGSDWIGPAAAGADIVSLTAADDGVELAGLTRSDPPPGSGC